MHDHGLGERAGNAALEEIVMALRTGNDYYKLTTSINTKKLYTVSRLVSSITGMIVQRNKAIVGQKFAHEAGIHQHGMSRTDHVRDHATRRCRVTRGATSCWGNTADATRSQARIVQLGYNLPRTRLRERYSTASTRWRRKKNVYDADVPARPRTQHPSGPTLWELEASHATSAGTGYHPSPPRSYVASIWPTTVRLSRSHRRRSRRCRVQWAIRPDHRHHRPAWQNYQVG